MISFDPKVRPSVVEKAVLLALAAIGVFQLGAANAQLLPNNAFNQPQTNKSPSSSYSDLASKGSPASVGVDNNSNLARFANAYGGDWGAMCSYAQNNIRYMPNFGLIKGGIGALQGGRGTSFDQSQLLVQAFRSAGGTARYKFGRVSISSTLAKNLTGIDASSPGGVKYIEDLFRGSGMPVQASGANFEILHVWTEAYYEGRWQVCDPSMQELELRPGTNFGASTALSTNTILSNSTANSVNTNGIQSSLRGAAAQFASVIDSNFGAAVPAMEDVIGGEFQIFDSEIRSQTGLAVQQAVTWSGGIPNALKAKVRIYGLPGLDTTLYADEVADERVTLRWISQDGIIHGFEDDGWEVPTQGYYELVSGHRSLREIEVPYYGNNAPPVTEQQIARSNSVAADVPGNGMPFWGAKYYQLSFDVEMPYPDTSFNRTAGDAIKKWVSPRGQNDLILAFGGISTKEKYSYTKATGADPTRHHIKSDMLMCADTGQGSVGIAPPSITKTAPSVRDQADGNYTARGTVRSSGDGGDFGNGGGGTINYECYPWDNAAFWRHGWDQRFDILSERDFIWRTWLANAHELANVLGRISNAKIVDHFHIGIANGEGGGNPPPPESRKGDGLIWLDAESAVSVVPSQSSGYSQRAIENTYAAFLSALELGAIEEVLLLDRIDWSSYGDNVYVDTLSNMQMLNSGILGFAGRANSGTLIKSAATNFNPGQFSGYPTGTLNRIKAFLDIDPANYVIMPRSITPGSSSQNDTPLFAYDASGSKHGLSFIIARDDDYAGDGMFFRKGAGGTLTDFGGIETVRSMTEADGVAFGTAITDAGDMDFELAPDLIIGGGEFPYALSFERTFNPNVFTNVPLGRGWSHNWQMSAEFSSSYSQLIRPANPRALGMTVAALQATLALSGEDYDVGRLLGAAETLSYWATHAKDNAVLVPAIGVFSKLPSGQFLPPPVPGQEAASLQVSSHAMTYTSPGRATIRFERLRPTDFCYPDAEAQCAYRNEGYGLRAPDSITRRYHATKWQFPTGMDIDFGYDAKTGVLKSVRNGLGYGFDFEYASDTACKYTEQDQYCPTRRRVYQNMVSVTDTANRRIEFKNLDSPNARWYSPGNCVSAFNAEYGYSISSPNLTHCHPKKDPFTLTLDGPRGRDTLGEFQPGDTNNPFMTVRYDSLFSGRDTARVDAITNANGNDLRYQAGFGMSSSIPPIGESGRVTQLRDQRGNLALTISPQISD